jgi:endonuclease/exonuclease/phosphatase family metal-dependent hydrolase
LRAYRPAAQELGTYKGTKRLDWILISQELSFVDYTVLPDVVSDHLAVLATIGWGEKEE